MMKKLLLVLVGEGNKEFELLLESYLESEAAAIQAAEVSIETILSSSDDLGEVIALIQGKKEEYRARKYSYYRPHLVFVGSGPDENTRQRCRAENIRVRVLGADDLPDMIFWWLIGEDCFHRW